MDSLSTLQALGLELPSPAYLFGLVLFGIIGMAAFGYGRRTGKRLTKWLGVALMLYPYGVSDTWLLYGVGALLSVAIVFDRG